MTHDSRINLTAAAIKINLDFGWKFVALRLRLRRDLVTFRSWISDFEEFLTKSAPKRWQGYFWKCQKYNSKQWKFRNKHMVVAIELVTMLASTSDTICEVKPNIYAGIGYKVHRTHWLVIAVPETSRWMQKRIDLLLNLRKQWASLSTQKFFLLFDTHKNTYVASVTHPIWIV